MDTDVIEDIKNKLKEVYDPEIPVNIFDLGLVYKIDYEEVSKQANILMTLTSPHCPVAEELPIWVQEAVDKCSSVEKTHVEITWEPPWTPEKMSEDGKDEMEMHMNMPFDGFSPFDPHPWMYEDDIFEIDFDDEK